MPPVVAPVTRPVQGCTALGIAHVDLGPEGHKYGHEIFSPLFGRHQQCEIPVCGGGVGVCPGLEEAQGILVFTELHLRNERGVTRQTVLTLQRGGVDARD